MKNIIVLFLVINTHFYTETKHSLKIAVEFVDHASAFFVAKDQKLFSKHNITIKESQTFTTGMALAAALARGDFDAALMCLTPALCCICNGKVPITIVTGLHKHGYALVVNSSDIQNIDELGKKQMYIGCPRQGSASDLLLQKIVQKYNLKICSKRIKRMPPFQMIQALNTNAIQAAVLPEQYPSMLPSPKYKILLNSQTVWPGMQGSVVIVRNSLLKNRPDLIKSFVKAIKEATDFIINHPQQSSKIVCNALNISKTGKTPLSIELAPEMILQSFMHQINFTNAICQKSIDEQYRFLLKLNYIKPAVTHNFFKPF
jgi:NitT/TauT family transport system substrate-binding protein